MPFLMIAQGSNVQLFTIEQWLAPPIPRFATLYVMYRCKKNLFIFMVWDLNLDWAGVRT